MKESKMKKVAEVKKRLEDDGHFVTERAGGHLTVAGVDLWATTEKWYDSHTKKRGTGIKSFMKHINSL